MRITVSKVIAALVALLLAGAAATYMASRDPALPGAEAFVASEPRVVVAVGTPHTTSLAQLRHVSGVPGGEAGYREYQFRVTGQRASVYATVRARRDDPWQYELISVK